MKSLSCPFCSPLPRPTPPPSRLQPNFREHFEISNPTPRYAGLLGLLPNLLVASPAQLRPLVQLLFSEMSLAFERQGLSLPPWRQSKSLLSKWLPSRSRDLELSPYASPRASSPETDFFALALGDPALLGGGGDVANTSGSLTPGCYAVFEDASPRAVLSSASAVLLSAQSAQGGAGQQQQSGNGGAALRPKSLLSSSLAAVGSGSSAIAARGSNGGSAAGTRQASPPQPSVHVSSTTGLTYVVAPAWQEPPIRTVKMQGSTNGQLSPRLSSQRSQQRA